ncbi:cupin domain-containing protein [Jannaschia marina]|uniref:cupin domain-containing protein n=1 Tax=Jannaschia marina TaxID=2741674 RepID=UPI0015CACC32|nr:cupin domain-containing protein [Jannaschia marina]
MKVTLDEKLARIRTHWDPHVVADYNTNDVMVVKFKGEFPFHSHADSDDFFLVLKGEMVMDIEGEESVPLGPGDLYVVPAGVRHRPRAEVEVEVLLIEPKGEPNTGDADAPAAPKPRL